MSGYARPGDCKHPTISDEQLVERQALIAATWGSAEDIKCPACDEYLYPHGDPDDDGIVYVGEPYGAGKDPWGRPNPSTNPEYWTE